MNRTTALDHLRASAEAVRGLGATALYLFGSTVRNEARPGSDLDLFIDYDPTSRFNAFDLVGIKLLLEDRLGLPIDIATRDGLHPRLRERIEASAARVFRGRTPNALNLRRAVCSPFQSFRFSWQRPANGRRTQPGL